MTRTYDDIFDDLDTVAEHKDGFDTLPAKTYVLATIKEVKPKTFRDGKASVEVVSKVDRVQGTVAEGNYGAPIFWDMLSFAPPGVPDPTLPEDEMKKAHQRAGFWARRVKTVGVDRKAITPDTTADQLAALFLPTCGSQVIIKTGVKAASGDYPARAVAYDYLESTPENLEKYGLDDPF